MRHENWIKTGHEKEEDKRSKHRPRWDRRVIKSLDDEESVDRKERMVADCQQENTMCEWSHIYDESEWSLMISLIRRLGFPYAQSAGLSFNEKRGSCAFCLDHVLLQSIKSTCVMAALIGGP